MVCIQCIGDNPNHKIVLITKEANMPHGSLNVSHFLEGTILLYLKLIRVKRNSMRFMLVVMGLLLMGLISAFLSLESFGVNDLVNCTGDREGKENLLMLKIAQLAWDEQESRRKDKSTGLAFFMGYE